MKLSLKDIYTDELITSSLGGLHDDLNGIRVDPGHLLTIRHVAAQNETNGLTKLTFGYALGQSHYELEEELDPGAGAIVWSSNYFLIPAGHFFRARFVGGTTGDILRLNLQGYIYELGA